MLRNYSNFKFKWTQYLETLSTETKQASGKRNPHLLSWVRRGRALGGPLLLAQRSLCLRGPGRLPATLAVRLVIISV